MMTPFIFHHRDNPLIWPPTFPPDNLKLIMALSYDSSLKKFTERDIVSLPKTIRQHCFKRMHYFMKGVAVG